MSQSWGMPYSDNPYAPRIPYALYIEEKTNFAGYLIAAIFYGIVVILFFQCMGALLDPTDRRRTGGIRWLLVVHTVTMFFFATINTATGLDLQAVSNVDDRAFPGNEELPPGPFGYNLLVFSNAITIVPNVMFILNNMLADGLLLYRCCVIYAMNYWVMAFPFLMYIACVGTGIVSVYFSSRPDSNTMSSADIIKFNAPYFSISVSLNVLLTLMIVLRLVLHSREIRSAMGSLVRPDRLYQAIVTILIESSALYAVSFLLFIGSWAAGSFVQNIFLQALAETQTIAPFLITLRMANRTAVTSESVKSGNIGSIHFRSAGRSTDTNENPTSSVIRTNAESY